MIRQDPCTFRTANLPAALSFSPAIIWAKRHYESTVLTLKRK